MENIFAALDNVPVGFRFRPTDVELVAYYLQHKLLDDDFPIHIIPEIDLCKVEPWDVPGLSVIKSDDQEWFFFSPIGYKYSNSKRVNRTTNRGYWKATGNDRYIKRSGTNDVIGSKKTLVFHQGRVPKGVKSNWVIHEYHAVTFPENQRNFVLCRLMKKAKTPERGTDALLCDEWGASTSGHIASSDYENMGIDEGIPAVGTFSEMSLETILGEIQFPTIQQSSIGIEQEASIANLLFDAYSGNENDGMEFPNNEEDDEFVNSFLVDDPELVLSEERRHAFVNTSTQSKSLRRVYNENSDTDIEVVSALHGNIVDTSTLCNEHPISSKYHASKMLKSSQGSVRGGVHHVSINWEANREKKDSIIRDDYWEGETSSCDSNADKPLEINCIEVSSSPSTQRNVARKSQTQRKIVSHVEAKKELTISKSEKDLLKARNTGSRANFEARSHQFSNVNRQGSFIFLETPSSSQSLFPRSVYLLNVVIGILLLIGFSWEVLS